PVLAFARDGVTLATASVDATIKVWERGKRVPATETRWTVLELKQFFTELRDDNESRALRAVLALAAVPKQTLALLRKGLPQGLRPDEKLLTQLLADLDDKRYAVRLKAGAELEKRGPSARQALRKALAGSPTLEARRRMERLLAKLEVPSSPADQLL